MKKFYQDEKDAYRRSIDMGLEGARLRSGGWASREGGRQERICRLAEAIKEAEAIVVGAGAGLSTSAGFTYSGERFDRYFSDFAQAYGIGDMYSGGFYPFPKEEIQWAWWARNIYFNRYVDAPRPVYQELLRLLEGKEYFVITTNVDHQFQKAGAEKGRLFYTQGDFGLFQCADGHTGRTYDNEAWVMEAMKAQGFEKDSKGVYQLPGHGQLSMELPARLIPRCPEDGSPVVMNLRVDNSFVEDAGWHRAAKAYGDFLDRHSQGRVLYLELGVGGNTPMIIKYPFWNMALSNPEAIFACINYGETFCPKELEGRGLCIDGDIGEVLEQLQGHVKGDAT